MQLLNNEQVRRIHCIGIGGIGVSALAEILIKRGFIVSGSDISDSERLHYLRSLGVAVSVGHDAMQVHLADLVVYSSAIHPDNPEFLAAIEKSIPLVKRGRLLAEVMHFYRGVAVAGTHGKTTTTALVSAILVAAGMSPTYFIGGIPRDTQSPVALGSGDVFISEVDESDASFLYLKPKLAIVTNIECDHLDTYAGSETVLRDSFVDFINAITCDGCAMLCRDDLNLQHIWPQLTAPVLWYGVDEAADYRIMQYQPVGLQGYASVKTSTKTLDVMVNLPGLHNMKNAVAAMMIAHALGVEDAVILQALSSFKGVGRRFQCHGEAFIAGKRVAIYEDYGHHPTEVKVTYDAARQAFPKRRVVLIFQPHRFTRTRDLLQEFAAVLSEVTHLILLPTYAASEAPIPGADSEALDAAIRQRGASPYGCLNDAKALEALLATLVQPEDVLLFQGAGDVGKLARALYINSSAP